MSAQGHARPRRRPLRVSTLIILLFSVFTAVLVLAMSLVTYNYSLQSLEARAVADNDLIIRQAAANIGRYIGNIESVSGIIETNREIREYLEDPDGENAGLLRTRFRSFLNYLPQINDGIEAIFIFNRDLEPVYSPSNLQMKRGYDVRQDSWYKAISRDATATPHLVGTSVRTMTKGTNPWVLAVARNILNDRTGEVIGAQVVELNYSVLHDILSDINPGERGYVFIVDSAGRMIYHPQLQQINFGLKSENVHRALMEDSPITLREEGKLYNTAPVPGTDYTVVGVTYLDSIVGTTRQMLVLYLFLTLLMAFAGYLGAVWLARYITRPLQRMDEAANRIRNGNLDETFDGQGTVETEHMADSLSAMIGRIRSLTDQAVKDQESIRVNEIRALQSQINPHFLYNTLDLIVWMAEESQNQDISALTMALATYFRTVLSSGADMITVREELGHVESYLFVQKTRFETLDYTVDAQQEALGLYMPKLLMQPIVENAIYHGIRGRASKGTIQVTVSLDEGRLAIRIRDNGRGMREKELAHIYEDKPPSARGKGSGIGLRNIRDRIQLYFGNEYGLEVRSTYGRGTDVLMTLPALREPQEHTRSVLELSEGREEGGELGQEGDS